MNLSAQPGKRPGRRLPSRRVIMMALAALVFGYEYSRPTLEGWLKVDLPAINRRGGRSHARSNSNQDDRYEANLPTASTNSGQSQHSGGHSIDLTGSGDFQLKEVGRDRYQTPAGLLYTMGPRGEHRIEHVMRHAKDQPNRPAHGVFMGNGDQDTVLQIIDDAYELVKSKSRRAVHEPSKGNDKYDVDMQRKIGFEGGTKGRRSNNRALNKVRMILDGNRVITAFPVR